MLVVLTLALLAGSRRFSLRQLAAFAGTLVFAIYLAILWTAFTAWSAGRALADQPLSSPAIAQWVAILTGPLALMGLLWLMFGRTRRFTVETVRADDDLIDSGARVVLQARDFVHVGFQHRRQCLGEHEIAIVVTEVTPERIVEETSGGRGMKRRMRVTYQIGALTRETLLTITDTSDQRGWLEPVLAPLFQKNDWRFVDAPQSVSTNDEMPAFCQSSKWLSMNVLSLSPTTVASTTVPGPPSNGFPKTPVRWCRWERRERRATSDTASRGCARTTHA